MARPTLRWGAALGLGALWWWAVLRLALVPDAGVVEGAVAAGGWGLSLLPVHCVPKRRATGALRAGRGAAAAGVTGWPTVASSAGSALHGRRRASGSR